MNLLNKVFSQHHLQDPPPWNLRKALAAVFAKKSGLGTNATVTSFPMKKKLGQKVGVSVLLRIPVYFS